MSKRFVIIRHAKSSWAELGMRDFDRPLNERGKTDAPEMGRRLLEYGLQPDAIYTSEANRTQQTTAAISKAMQFDGDLIVLQKLYHAPADVIENVIATANDTYNTIFIVAHNPGVTEFLLLHCKQLITDNMPTCAIAAFEMQSNSWADFYTSKQALIKFDFPKNR